MTVSSTMPDDTDRERRGRRYYLCAATVPLLAGVVSGLLVLLFGGVPPSPDTALHTIFEAATLVGFLMLYGGPPYLLFLLCVWRTLARGTAKELRRLSWIAPIATAVSLAVLVVAISLVTESKLPRAQKLIFYPAMTLIVGSIVLAPIDLLFHLGSTLGWWSASQDGVEGAPS